MTIRTQSELDNPASDRNDRSLIESMQRDRKQEMRGALQRNDQSFTTEVITEYRNFAALSDDWNALAQDSKSPMMAFDWFDVCASTLCPPGKLYVIVVRAAGIVSAIAPLMLLRRNGAERLEILGSSFLGEPSGLLYRDMISLKSLLKAILSSRKPIFLGRLTENSLEALMLRTLLDSYGGFFNARSSASPWLLISGSWQDFGKRISSRRRSSLRRSRKHADQHGKVEFEFVTPNSGTVDSYMEELIHVEASSWKARNKSSMRSMREVEQFFRIYAQTVARSGMLRMCFMRIDNETIAAQLAVVFNGSWWILKIGYNEAFRDCSPGTLLMHEAVRYAFEQNLENFEFLGNEEEWIKIWTREAHPYFTFRIFPNNIPGLVSLSIEGSKFIASKVARSLHSNGVKANKLLKTGIRKLMAKIQAVSRS